MTHVTRAKSGRRIHFEYIDRDKRETGWMLQEEWEKLPEIKRPSPPPITEQQKKVILHALGLDLYRKPCRNGYSAMMDGASHLEEMVNIGLLTRGKSFSDGKLQFYHVTEAGALAAGAYLPF